VIRDRLPFGGTPTGSDDVDGTAPVGIDVEGVSVTLGGARVLDSVSLSVSPGSFVGLVGPNGAGKTTLLRTINATLSPESGTVRVGDTDVHELSSRGVGRRVATVPQDTAVSFDFTVRQVVEMGRHPHRPRFGADPDPEAVDRALERTGTERLAERSIGGVSGGERQRAVIARALAQDAPAMVLDEPTASLDVNHQVETLDLVADLVEDGHTAIAAIHDLNLAARYCDELALVADGELVAHDEPRDVLTEDRLAETFDADAVVADHPVTGSPLVTALGSRQETARAREDVPYPEP
jgi:iron complex transport system ATP-binding protein